MLAKLIYQRRLIQQNTMMIAQILDHYHSWEQGRSSSWTKRSAYDKVELELPHIDIYPQFGFQESACQAIGYTRKALVRSQLMLTDLENGLFPIQQGLPQGNPMSPILYDIVLGACTVL